MLPPFWQIMYVNIRSDSGLVSSKRRAILVEPIMLIYRHVNAFTASSVTSHHTCLPHQTMILADHVLTSLKTRRCHYAYFVITGGTGCCHDDNIRYLKRPPNEHKDNSLFSVLMDCSASWQPSDNKLHATPDSKVHGDNMGPTWVLSAPGGPHVGLMNRAIWDNSLNDVIIHPCHNFNN